MTLVKFKADIYPHVKDDVVDLSDEELKAVKETAKKRDISTPFEELKVKKSGDSDK